MVTLTRQITHHERGGFRVRAPSTGRDDTSVTKAKVTTASLAHSSSPGSISSARLLLTPRFRSSQHRDERVQPSRASGGIPDPSPAYLVHASLPPLLLPHPRQILVVIDLNGTLLYRPKRKYRTEFIERPHARRFLSYCLDTFHVVIWSSAKSQNVRAMCEQLMEPEQFRTVVAMWGRDKFGLDSADYNRRVQCYKRLSTLWAATDVARTHPRFDEGVRWSQADTVLIDDSLEKARSEPYNLIRIPEFFGDPNEPGYILPQIHDYINECSRQADISTYIRVSPFQAKANFMLGAPAIANAAAPAA